MSQYHLASRPSRLLEAPMLNGPSDWAVWYAYVLEAAYYYGVDSFFTSNSFHQWNTLQHQLFDRLWEEMLAKIGDRVFTVLQAAGDADLSCLWNIIRACCDDSFNGFIGEPLINSFERWYRD